MKYYKYLYLVGNTKVNSPFNYEPSSLKSNYYAVGTYFVCVEVLKMHI